MQEDCRDISDEHNCTTIIVPGKYKGTASQEICVYLPIFDLNYEQSTL
jgi:hypothetical protein